MITIYDRMEVGFLHRGLGTLPDAEEAEVQEEINGVFDLRLLYPKDGLRANLLQEERVLKASTPKGEQLFRIESLRKDMNYIEVQAVHVFYDLRSNFIEDTFIQNKGGAGAVAQVLEKSIVPHRFNSSSDIQGVRNCRLVRKNTVDALLGDEDNTLLSRWGGEFERDNFTIRWVQKMGQDRGVKIKYRRNLTGLDFTVDLSGVVTKIMPQGFDGLLLPEKYVDSPMIGNFHTVKILKIEYDDVISEELSPEIEGAVPHEEALQSLRNKAVKEYSLGLDKPRIYCEVDFVDLAQTEEYKHYQDLEKIHIGDTVQVSHPELGVTVEDRMTFYAWDCLRHRYIHMLIGQPDNMLVGAITGAQSTGQAALEKIADMRPSIMETAHRVATELINAGFGGHVRIYPDRILIMDTENEATAQKVWQWNINGLGFSDTGVNGVYETAMVDGLLLGERIVAGSITLNKLASDVGQGLDISSNVSITSKVSRDDLLTDPELQQMIISNTEPEEPNERQLWLDTSTHPNIIKRWDGAEWETVSDVQQIQDALDSKVSHESLSDELQSIVASITASYQSEFEQTAADINFRFTEVIDAINAEGGRITGLSNEIETNIRFTASGIEMGKTTSPISIQIMHNRIAFVESGREVAYFSNNTLFITDVNITGRFTFHNFGFTRESNGSITWGRVT